MGTLSHIDQSRAKNNPEQVFSRPEDVVDEVGLTRGEKIALLVRWAQTVQRRLDSAAEGMAPEPDPRPGAAGETVDDDAELLRRIEIVTERLRDQKGA
jgi:hypothetical protein